MQEPGTDAGTKAASPVPDKTASAVAIRTYEDAEEVFPIVIQRWEYLRGQQIGKRLGGLADHSEVTLLW